MGIVRQIKHVTGGYTSSQVKVRDASANDDTMPPRMLMQEIADLTYRNQEVLLIMDVIDKRLNDKGKYWRHVHKSLILLDYLVHVGSDKVVMWCHENLYIIKTLREFSYRDDTGKDVGKPIRERAVRLTALLSDPNRLRAERERFSRSGRRARSRRRSRSSESDSADDELERALQLSRETAAQEEERRQMAGRSVVDSDLQRAMNLSQQNEQNMGLSYEQQQQFLLQQQQQRQEEAALAQAQQAYLQAQQTAQLEAQQLYALQAQQTSLLNQFSPQYATQMPSQYADPYANQAANQTATNENLAPTEPLTPLEPLKTGSNNPFAAFNQQQQQNLPTQPPSQQPQSNLDSGTARPYLHRQSTFDKDHMDRLDSILNLNAPMDTFGNTGSAMIPAQHTENTGFVDSSGRGLTATLTARKTGSNNPFASSGAKPQYTGLAATQMQPAHTGYGFGNANHSSTNLIDL